MSRIDRNALNSRPNISQIVPEHTYVHGRLRPAARPTMTALALAMAGLVSAPAWAAGITINGSTLSVSSDADLGEDSDGVTLQGGTLEATSSFTSNRAFELDGNGSINAAAGQQLTLTGEILGSGGLTAGGAGTLVLMGVNNYQKGTTIAGGTLSVSSDANLGEVPGGDLSKGKVMLQGGTLEATSSFASARVLILTDGGSINVGAGQQLTLNGDIRGLDGLTAGGAGTLVLTRVNNYQGGTTIAGGTLSVSSDANLGEDSGGVTLQGGTLKATSGLTTRRAITLAGAGVIDASGTTGTSDVVLNGVISGPGSLTLTGPGTGSVKLGSANTYQGGTNVYTDVGVYATGALGTGGVTVQGGVAGGAVASILSFQNSTSAGNLSIRNNNGGRTAFENGATAGNATITNAAGGVTAFSGEASAGSAEITNQSGGRLLMAGQASAAGATVVNAAGGVVDIGQTSAGAGIGSLSGAGNVYLGGKQLTLGALNSNDTISGVIADGGDAPGTGGSLMKAGAGTLILNGVNTYTGGTTVNAGTLKVGDADHPSAGILGDVQVNTGGTLRGHGSIAGNVNNNGIVRPGGSIGTLTISGNYTQSSSGMLLMEISPTQAAQLKVGGTATLAGTLSLLYAPGTYTSTSYTLLSAAAVNGSFSTVTSNAPAGLAQALGNGADALNLSLTGSGSVVVAPTQATIFGAVGSSALRAAQDANAALLDRLAGPCGTAADASASGSAQSCPRQGNGLWIQAQGTDRHIDGNRGAPDARDRGYGFLTGVDHQWKDWTMGVAGGYSHADVTESGNGSKGTLDTLRIAGYGAKNLGAFTLAGTLGYAYGFSSTTRSFGLLGSAKGDGHGQEITAGLQASRPWSLGPVVLTPRVGVRYAYLDGLGTDESGPTAQNLGVANRHQQSLQPYIGVTLDYPFTLHNNKRPASVQLRAGYAYETQSTGRNVSVTAADGTGFVIAGTRDTRGLVTAGLGATLPIGKTASAYVRYDSVLHSGNVNAQSLQAGVDYQF
ncbi:autotransporter outer membrane beta-barrel domain-containing protein [Eoetvoesiella caeni]|uniref:Autotransporter-associated beta strand protein n=1 Tax=Eoetvoesiella caeni TaxID=645616 RepID=A0A366H1P2_9BURK|nr:autotransporter outer membrane beta-barrel domain-containing protein [Eoetvoesiella caeni]MCI2811107.1 autotransporter domain-containing protein [Eoetvoesiella caeni]NYT56980.1 autotransporter domain-containing protein [Eoetvoesiella caeni]RBP35142.1 autotransporter-associated beta strand protein [Eoetvoesiella caeni]